MRPTTTPRRGFEKPQILRRWLWKFSAAAVGVAALTWGLGAAAEQLRDAEFFRLRQVKISGHRYLSSSQLLAALPLGDSISTLDPLDSLANRLRAIAGVKAVKLSRRLPGTLTLEIVESEPVAICRNEGVLVLVDSAGTVLPFDPTLHPTDLPFAPIHPGVVALLGRLKHSRTGLFDKVEAARLWGNDVLLQLGEEQFLLTTEAREEEFQALVAVAADLKQRGAQYRQLDARYAGRIFARLGAEG